MKKLFAGLVLFIVTVILLSSCSNSSKLALTKRHYRSGYYVDFGGKSQKTIASAAKPVLVKTKGQVATIVATKPENYAEVNTPIALPEIPTIVAKIVNQNRAQENNLVGTGVLAANQKTFTVNTLANYDISGSTGDGHHDRNSVSVPFVVIVLCAIFIPPLGVGLMYGINSYFWIDLILTLLFFFPGMIFALIVVLM